MDHQVKSTQQIHRSYARLKSTTAYTYCTQTIKHRQLSRRFAFHCRKLQAVQRQLKTFPPTTMYTRYCLCLFSTPLVITSQSLRPSQVAGSAYHKSEAHNITSQRLSTSQVKDSSLHSQRLVTSKVKGSSHHKSKARHITSQRLVTSQRLISKRLTTTLRGPQKKGVIHNQLVTEKSILLSLTEMLGLKQHVCWKAGIDGIL